ncbi:MAG TPA: response regulator [Cytophagales bacterium]|nr:response regulator [Cytophagales bacterium]
MNTKLKCLLLDDELPGLAYLKMICEQMQIVEVVKVYNDPLKLLEEHLQMEYDLCILDIEMPNLSGLEVAQQLKGKSIIFTTAYKEYAAEAYDIEAVDYIRKPIQKERLEKAIQKVYDKQAQYRVDRGFIQLNTQKGKTLLYFNQILVITTSTVDKRDKIAYLTQGEQLLLKNISFEELLSTLPKEKFCRINKKGLIALHAVDSFTHDLVSTTVEIQNGGKLILSLSDTFRSGFLQLISF